MQQRSSRSIIVAILTGLCGLAGTLATGLPDSPVQQGAEKVANVCEANGFRAWPEVAEPSSPAEDAGTPSPTLPPVLEAPMPEGVQRAALGEGQQPLAAASRRWLGSPPPAEAWRGESRGWC